MKPWILYLVVAAGVSSAHAVGNYKQAMDKKVNSYLAKGVFVGGTSGKGFTLLSLRRHYAKSHKVERVILDIGDEKGLPLKGDPSYFEVSIEQNPPRAVIHLAQVQRSGVDQDRLAKAFGKSPIVASSGIAYDPQDKSTQIVLNFKAPTGVEVFEMKPAKGRPSRIVLDLKARK